MRIRILRVRAEAEIHIPQGEGTSLIQWIHSGGLYGIESDSENTYFQDTAKDELHELKDVLQRLNVDMSNFDELSEKAIAEMD